MYGEAFCKVYNEFGWNYFPEAFAGQLLLWLKAHYPEARSCLDIGCGTGVLCGALAEAGLQARGIDLSENMIAIARRQYPKAEFAAANMVSYRPERQFDLVTCTGDALNHILDPEDLKQVFAGVHAALTPGGYFIADILNEKEAGSGDTINFAYDDTTSAAFTIRTAPDGIVTLTIAVSENGVPKFQEQITEKLHDPQLILQLLQQAGFGELRLSHKLLEEQDSQAVTWFITARK